MRKRKKKRKGLWKKLLLILLGLLLAAGLGTLLVTKVFVVKNVTVEGNVLYDDERIEKTLLNDEYSWSSLYVLLKYTFTETGRLPFIDTMEIEMTDPQSLKITVYEKGLLGYLYLSAIDRFVYFDKDGFVVETSERVIEGIPKIEGLSCDEVVLYEKLPIEEKLLKELLMVTQALKREGMLPEVIRYGQLHAPVLVYGDVQVRLGSTEYLTQKVQRIQKILPRLDGMSGILHLEDWNEQTSNVVFEKAE